MVKTKRNKQRTSVSKKFLKKVIPMICIGVIAIFLMDMYYQWNTVHSLRREEMKCHVENMSERIETRLTTYASILENVQKQKQLTPETLDEETKKQLCEELGFEEIGAANSKGINEQGADISSSKLFNEAQNTMETYFGQEDVRDIDPQEEDNQTELKIANKIVISVPIISETQFEGIIYARMDASVISSILENGTGDEKNSNFLTDNIGKEIEFKKEEKEEKQESAELKQLDLEGESGYLTFSYNGEKNYGYYNKAEISNCYIVSAYPMSTYTSFVFSGIAMKTLLVVCILVIISLLIYHMMKNMLMPIHQCVERMEHFAQGDMHSEIVIDESYEETYQLTMATQKVSRELSNIMNDIEQVLGKIAGGDLTATPGDVYKGDFQSIKISIVGIIKGFSNILNQLMEASVQVTKGSEQVSDGATSLSASATDQMIMLQKSYVAISKITEYLKEIVRSSEKEEESEDGENKVIKMEELTNAMKHISEFSEQIQQIVKMIANISSQTKMLSINASVEAARAGNAGKGFSVVAEEIRTLSSKSRDATNDTKKLVVNVISAVEHGSTTVQDTVTSVEEIAKLINDFRDSLIKISGNVEDTAAISEESAAASEQLKEQAMSLQEMVEQFTLMAEGENKHE